MTIGTVYVMGCNVAVIVVGVLPFRRGGMWRTRREEGCEEGGDGERGE